MTVMGLKNPKPYTNKQIVKEAKKQNIPTDNLFVLDPSFDDYLLSLDTSILEIKYAIKNHYQPAKVIYFDSLGQNISFHINCYAQGYRSKWNAMGNFDVFPPKTAAPLDTVLNMVRLFEFVKPLESEKIYFDSTEYTAVVFFNRVLRGRNRRLVKEVVKNAELSNGKEFQVLYVNNDAFMYKVLDSTIYH